jgi:hypothetical protein
VINGIVLKTGEILIASEITKIVPDEYNDPDLEIINPYIMLKTMADSVYIKPYLCEFTDQLTFSFRSDDILTLFSPKESLIEEYKNKTIKEEQLNIDLESENNVRGEEED